LNNATELKSVALAKNALPEWLKLDERGIINHAPLANDAFYQFSVCGTCYCSGKLHMHRAQWNSLGLGAM